ncbi:MAG: hypothetical protein U1E65_35140 [Myxococcota bacterium]
MAPNASTAFGVWWTALRQRVDELGAKVPPALKGTILIELRGPGLEVAYRALRLAEGRVEIVEHHVPGDDALLSFRGDEMPSLLQANLEPPEPEVWGDTELVDGFFQHLASRTSQSLLSLRARR